MKCKLARVLMSAFRSLPVRGAWIEIEYSSVMPKVYVVSLPVRGAWIEIFKQFKIVSFISSLPVRGAWIEIVFGTMVTDICQSLPVRGAWIEIYSIRLPI